MKTALFLFLLLLLLPGALLQAQAIDKALLAKFSQRAEQEKIINQQAVLLQLTAQQAALVKTVSFYYIDKALVMVNANINSSRYGLYRKLKPLKEEYESAMAKILHPGQLQAWEQERKEHGLAARLMK